ncbi:phage portal protein family protein [Endozoicomonas sp. 2B-B]
MAKAYTTLLAHPDSVIQQRGRDLKLYEEILRDGQVKSCFQQRRLAVTHSLFKLDNKTFCQRLSLTDDGQYH